MRLYRRALGDLVKHGKCRVFTLIAGSIVRILLNHGVLPEELFLTEDNRTLYSKFPNSKHHDMDWVLAFGEFVDEFVMAKKAVEQYVILPTSLTIFSDSLLGHQMYSTLLVLMLASINTTLWTIRLYL